MDILDLDWQVDLDQAYEMVGPDVVRCGNIDPVVVQNKSSDEIFSMCSDLLEREKGRKYILSAGCEITVNTPPENLLAMRKASYTNEN
jgi:uroporphyrinogen decarboxylase